VLSGCPADDLLVMLRKRGWWRLFDPVVYARLEPYAKLGEMVEAAGITESDLIKLLGASSPECGWLVGGTTLPAPSGPLAPRADRLLSILGYLLDLAGYEPELVADYWRMSGLFQGSVERPPWDATGLVAYLAVAGEKGLVDAVGWIRSH